MGFLCLIVYNITMVINYLVDIFQKCNMTWQPILMQVGLLLILKCICFDWIFSCVFKTKENILSTFFQIVNNT